MTCWYYYGSGVKIPNKHRACQEGFRDWYGWFREWSMHGGQANGYAWLRGITETIRRFVVLLEHLDFEKIGGSKRTASLR
ncbi:MAG: hypothetical protein HN352_07685 [Bacteroidetes bacterium]|nr:hypothetical protein [Bacteroidota bacterium]MBT3751556.1 hypothetical protein [Bacteroidota bacterium]MBT4410595.1 hypothetical protein [Bacteroidota bacterium]MBT7093026.1 hypothetical protein [Bacteroidota bacterium]MBT7466040.1 hypothetical protein [Bacteroidota bacterium]